MSQREAQLWRSLKKTFGPSERPDQKIAPDASPLPPKFQQGPVGPAGPGQFAPPRTQSGVDTEQALQRVQEYLRSPILQKENVKPEELPDAHDLYQAVTGGANARLQNILDKVDNPYQEPKVPGEGFGAKPVELRSPRQRAIFNLIVQQYEGLVQRKLLKLYKEYAGYRKMGKAKFAQEKMIEMLELYQHLSIRQTQIGILSKLFEITTPKEYQTAVAQALSELGQDKLEQMVKGDASGETLKAYVAQKLMPILQQHGINEAAGSNEFVNELGKYAWQLAQTKFGININEAPMSNEERYKHMRERGRSIHPMVDADPPVNEGPQGRKWISKHWQWIAGRAEDYAISQSSSLPPDSQLYNLTQQDILKDWDNGKLYIRYCKHDIGCGASAGHPEKCTLDQNDLNNPSWKYLAKEIINFSKQNRAAPQTPPGTSAPPPTQPQAPSDPNQAPEQAGFPPGKSPAETFKQRFPKPPTKQGSMADEILEERSKNSKPWYRRA